VYGQTVCLFLRNLQLFRERLLYKVRYNTELLQSRDAVIVQKILLGVLNRQQNTYLPQHKKNCCPYGFPIIQFSLSARVGPLTPACITALFPEPGEAKTNVNKFTGSEGKGSAFY